MVARVRINRKKVALIACLLVPAACDQPPPAGNPSNETQHQQLAELSQGEGPMPFDPQRGGGSADDVIVVGISFTVERYVVPSDVLAPRRSDIWTLVDELRIEPADVAHLKNNGLRIGVAGRAETDVLRELMAGLDARREVITRNAQSGAPVTLDFGSTGSYRTVYLFHRDGRLEGTTFDDAAKFVHIDYHTELRDDAPRITLALRPELFKESDRPHWRVTDGQFLYEKEYHGAAYRELTVEVPVLDGEMLVVAPSAAAENAYLVGSTILSDVLGGRRWETVVMITPRLYRTTGAGEPGS